MKKTILLPILLSVFMLTSISISAQKFFPSLDTFIQQNVATTPQDSTPAGLFKIECRKSAALSRIGFIEFNLGSLSKQCTKAEVNLYCYETANSGDEDVEMYEVTSGVFDMHTTWNSFNAAYTLGTTYLSKNTVINASVPDPNTGLPATAAWYKFDITTLVNKAAATTGTDKKIRVCVKAVTGNLAVRFYSVNVKTEPDWNFVADYAPFLDVQSLSAVSEVKNSDVASIYKNTYNQITIDCKYRLSSDASAIVYNAIGQKLSTINISDTKTIISNKFSSGIYMIKVTNAGVSTTQKVILD
jgi:hypothetical protein